MSWNAAAWVKSSFLGSEVGAPLLSAHRPPRNATEPRCSAGLVRPTAVMEEARVDEEVEDAATPFESAGQPARETMLTANPRSVGVLILATLAIIYTLYVGQELLLPITLALLLKLLLRQPMRFLTRRLRLPDPIAALLVMLA